MQTKVTIEIWSDIVCPFCYIGKKKIELAIAKLNAEDQVDIIWRNFQLGPDFPMNTSIPTNEYLIQARGYPKEQVEVMTEQLKEQGKSYGIDFQFNKALSFNTMSAHRLIQWAKNYDKSNELKEALMISYFTEGTDLSVSDNLMLPIKKVGLDTIEARKILESAAYTEDVEQDISRARQLGIRGVPYFLIDGKTTISGAQNDNIFENFLATALNSIRPFDNISQEGICDLNGECK